MNKGVRSFACCVVDTLSEWCFFFFGLPLWLFNLPEELLVSAGFFVVADVLISPRDETSNWNSSPADRPSGTRSLTSAFATSNSWRYVKVSCKYMHNVSWCKKRMYVTKDSPFPSGRRTLRTELGDIPAGTVAWRRGMRLMAPLARLVHNSASVVEGLEGGHLSLWRVIFVFKGK